MTKNKKNKLSLVGVLALFVALTVNVHAQTTTQPIAPATQPVQAPVITPDTIFRLMFGPAIQANAAPSPKDLEDLYHTVWTKVATRYYNSDALSDWGKWEHAYDGKLQTTDDLDKALKDMLRSLSDPWTKFVSTTDMKDSRRRDNEGIVSLGISTRVSADSNVVISFLDFGSPAYNSALRSGDVLKSVDGKPFSGITAEAADELLTGKVGNEMTITYVRDGAETTIKLVLAKHFEGKSEASILPGKVLYVRLPAFDETSYEAFEQAINNLRSKPDQDFEAAFDYIVLDLRGNAGGDLSLALHMVETFMSDGVAFAQSQRNGRVQDETVKRVSPFLPFLGKGKDVSVCQTDILHKKPMAVLVNGSSASSAEVVTAALGENKRATVIGTKTWGKAVAWNAQRLPNGGALFMTISGLKGPGGKSWHKVGLTPDLSVEQPREGSVDVQLLKAIEDLTKK